MSSNVYYFTSFADLIRYIDGQIGSLEESLSQLKQRYNVVKARAEKLRQLEKVLEELVGEKISTLNEVDFMGLRVVINARAVDELRVLEDAIASQEDTLSALKRVRDVLKKLHDSLESSVEAGGLTIIVQTRFNIPVRILLKEAEE